MTTKTRKPRSAGPATATLSDISGIERTQLATALSASPATGAGSGEQELEPPTLHDVGENVFDVFDGFGTQSQRVCWRAIANSSLAVALYAANSAYGMAERELEGEEIDSAQLNAARYRVSLYSDLYVYAQLECKALADSKYDLPMEPEGMFDLLTSGEPQPRENDTTVFEATLKAMDITGEEAEAMRQTRKQTLLRQAKKNQATMRERRLDILDEIGRGDARFVPEQFDHVQHLKFFKTVFTKLRAAGKRALTFVGQYDDAVVDALQYNADANRVDKSMAAYRRRNRENLQQFEQSSPD